MNNEQNATFMGIPANQGKLIPRQPVSNEGFALLICGNTEIVLSYTLLHHLRFELDKDSPMWTDIRDANNGLSAITAEASIGRIPPSAPTAAPREESNEKAPPTS